MTFSDLKKKYETIQKLIEAVDNEELNTLSKFMRNRISTPESYVTMLGETSSGKTTLINSLLHQSILRTSATPTSGSIVEVVFDSEIKNPEYYAINTNATKEHLDLNTFTSLSSNPDEFLTRLQIAVPDANGLAGLRLFDTPGYGSIIEQHEEVLCDFIPNSDVIVYVIGYKIGIQENDFQFLRYIQQLIHDETDILIVINRCPTNITEKDRRLIEIRTYSEELLHKKVPIFTVPSSESYTDETRLLGDELWAKVIQLVNTPERQQALIKTLSTYLDDLLMKADSIIEKHELSNIMSRDEKEYLRNSANELRQKGTTIINSEIDPTFSRLITEAPKHLNQSKNLIYSEITAAIDSESKAKMDETFVFVNNHLLPMSITREIKEYEQRLMLELDSMNDRIDDYLNEAIANYYHEIELQFANNAELAARTGGGKIIGKVMENGLTRYFAAYGGAGGAGAGVANAAKHLLKKGGDLLGKKFSRETYNALARTLKKMGATSVKAIGNAVVVIIEVGQVFLDYTTWKLKLKKQLNKALDNWYEKTIDIVTKDLDKLKEQNIETLREIINETAASFELEEVEFDENISSLILLKKEIHKQLEDENIESRL